MASRLAPGLRLLARRQVLAPRRLALALAPAPLPRPALALRGALAVPASRGFSWSSRRSDDDKDDARSDPNSSTNPDGSKKSSYQRFKDLTKTYGSYAVLMYLALSAIDYSLSFAFVHAIGVERLEPYVDRMTHAYRSLRYGAEEADRIRAEHEAELAADRVEAAAEAAQERLAGRKHEVAWYNNKQLWAEAALAYPIHKILLLPVRAGLTVAWTPKVVNWLRARGWIGAVSRTRTRTSTVLTRTGRHETRRAARRRLCARAGQARDGRSEEGPESRLGSAPPLMSHPSHLSHHSRPHFNIDTSRLSTGTQHRPQATALGPQTDQRPQTTADYNSSMHPYYSAQQSERKKGRARAQQLPRV